MLATLVPLPILGFYLQTPYYIKIFPILKCV